MDASKMRDVVGADRSRNLSEDDIAAFFDALRDRGSIERMFDFLPDVSFYIKDRQCRWMACNTSAVQSLNFRDRVEIIGATEFDFFPRQIADGSFAAFLVNHKSPASRAKYKLYLKTGVIVTHDGNGDAHVFAELKQAPTESQKLALVFVAAQSGPFQIGTVTLGKGHVVESAPHALPKFKRSDYTELQLDFPLRPKNQGKVVVLCSAQAGIGLIFGPWGPLATGGACVISQLF